MRLGAIRQNTSELRHWLEDGKLTGCIPGILEFLKTLDPTEDKKHIRWLAHASIHDRQISVNSSIYRRLLEYSEAEGTLIDTSDSSHDKLKTWHDLARALYEGNDKFREELDGNFSASDHEKAEKESIVLHNTPGVSILMPTTFFAASVLLSGSTHYMELEKTGSANFISQLTISAPIVFRFRNGKTMYSEISTQEYYGCSYGRRIRDKWGKEVDPDEIRSQWEHLNEFYSNKFLIEWCAHTAVPQDLWSAEMWYSAAYNHGKLLDDVPAAIKTSEFWKKLILEEPQFMRRAPAEALDEEFILEYLDNELRRSNILNAHYFAWVPNELKTEKTYIAAIKVSSDTVEEIPANAITKTLAEAIAEHCPDWYDYIPSEMITKDIVQIAVSHRPQDIDRIPKKHLDESLRELAKSTLIDDINSGRNSLGNVPKNLLDDEFLTQIGSHHWNSKITNAFRQADQTPGKARA